MNQQYDVIIVGAGIVGASLALVLANSSLKVALVEAKSLHSLQTKTSTERTIVLSHSSRVIFETMGVWDKFATQVCPIQEVHVSDKGNFGSTRILAEDEKLFALGYVLSSNVIDTTLHDLVTDHEGITIIQPASFVSFDYNVDGVNVEITHEGEQKFLNANLLVGADGHHSKIRTFKNIKVSMTDYGQSAVICNVTLKRPHSNIAYERFAEQGPLAMLPLLNQQSAVVWTVKRNEAKKLLELEENVFKKLLQKSFGYRLGKIMQCSKPVSIDLHLVTATQQIAPGMVLLGNAAHTLHPVAGQGLNLALRDLAALAEKILLAKQKNQSLGSLETLQSYFQSREEDQKKVISLTHSLVGIFSNGLLPIIFARDVGMFLFDRIPWLKKILTKRTLGMSGKVPRLACGMTLE